MRGQRPYLLSGDRLWSRRAALGSTSITSPIQTSAHLATACAQELHVRPSFTVANITELLAYLAAPTRYEVCTSGITYLIEQGSVPIGSWASEAVMLLRTYGRSLDKQIATFQWRCPSLMTTGRLEWPCPQCGTCQGPAGLPNFSPLRLGPLRLGSRIVAVDGDGDGEHSPLQHGIMKTSEHQRWFDAACWICPGSGMISGPCRGIDRVEALERSNDVYL